MVDAIVISDLHLGSDVCLAKELIAFLKVIKHKTKKVILNGDIFDNHNFAKLKKNHWKILRQLRKITNDIQVIWVVGNHDGPSDLLACFTGLHIANEYEFVSGEKRILVVHGDRFDHFISDYPWLAWFAETIHRFCQKISYKFSRWLKLQSKSYLHCSDVVEKRAFQHAIKRSFDAILVGHTHLACYSEQNNVEYFNSGSWTEYPCHYIEVNNGTIGLREFSAV